MSLTWITLYPRYYVDERRLLALHYPQLEVDESLLQEGHLVLYGPLKIRPPGGTTTVPISLIYPEGTPFEPPTILPLICLPEPGKKPRPKLFDYRHQMPGGALCLFQRETRLLEGKDIIRGIDVLRRAEQWFLGHHTGHWPPDTAESELETHFRWAGDALLSEVAYSANVQGHGRLFLVKDFLRLSSKLADGPPPRIMAAFTQERQIIAVFDARTDMGRLSVDKVGSLDSGKNSLHK